MYATHMILETPAYANIRLIERIYVYELKCLTLHSITQTADHGNKYTYLVMYAFTTLVGFCKYHFSI